MNSITFEALATGETQTVNGLTFTAAKNLTAAEVAAAFSNLTLDDRQDSDGVTANGIYSGEFSDTSGGTGTAWTSGAANGATVTFTGYAHNTTTITASGKVSTVTATAGVDNDDYAISDATLAYGEVIVTDDAAAAITTITLDGFNSADINGADALTTLNIANNTANGNVTVDTDSTTLALNVNNITSTTSVVSLDDSSATVTDLTITASGAASTFDLTAIKTKNLTVNANVALNIATNAGTHYATAELLTVDVNGAGNVNLGTLVNSVAINSFNASGNTGGVTATIDTDATTLTGDIADFIFSGGNDVVTVDATSNVSDIKVTLGAGDDKVIMDSDNDNATALIDGGTGTNTIHMDSVDAAAATAASTLEVNIANFTKLSVGEVATTAQDTVDLDNLDDISYVISAGSADEAHVVEVLVTETITTTTVGDTLSINVGGVTHTYTTTGITWDTEMAAFAAQIATDDARVAAAAWETGFAAATLGITFEDGVVAPVSTFVADMQNVSADVTAANSAITVASSLLTLDNMANNGTLEFAGLDEDNTGVVVNMTDATGETDTFNIISKMAATAYTAGTVQVNGVETINITSSDILEDDDENGTVTTAEAAVEGTIMGLYADAVKTLNLDGNSTLDLTLVGTNALTTIDATDMTEALTISLSGTKAITLNAGSGDDDITAIGSQDIINAGAGDDNIDAGVLTSMTGGTGVDTFTMTTLAGANEFSQIMDIESGDIIQATAGNTFVSEEFALVGATLSDYLNTIITDSDENETVWFNLTVEGVDYTFIVDKQTNASATEFTKGTDMVIAIVGTYDLSTDASYNATTGTIEIA